MRRAGIGMPNLAANLVQRCLRIRPEDNVTIFFYPHTQDLAEDIAVECFRAGADALLNLYTDRYYEAYMRLLTAESRRKPSVFCRGLTELSTAEFWLGALYDPAIFRKIPPDKMAANNEGETEAHMPAFREKKVRSLFVGLGQVTRPRARAYGLSFPAWARMMREATAVRADKLSADGRKLAARLERANEVRVHTEDGTDLTFSIRGRAPRVYDGVVDEQDVARGVVEDSVPAGSVTGSIEETRGESRKRAPPARRAPEGPARFPFELDRPRRRDDRDRHERADGREECVLLLLRTEPPGCIDRPRRGPDRRERKAPWALDHRERFLDTSSGLRHPSVDDLVDPLDELPVRLRTLRPRRYFRLSPLRPRLYTSFSIESGGDFIALAAAALTTPEARLEP